MTKIMGFLIMCIGVQFVASLTTLSLSKGWRCMFDALSGEPVRRPGSARGSRLGPSQLARFGQRGWYFG